MYIFSTACTRQREKEIHEKLFSKKKNFFFAFNSVCQKSSIFQEANSIISENLLNVYLFDVKIDIKEQREKIL